MLEVRDLDAFYGDAQALWGVDLRRRPAERSVCVVGPNGAGKSTLVHAIAGLHRARARPDHVDGNDFVARCRPPRLRPRRRHRARGAARLRRDDRLGQPLPWRLPARRPPVYRETLERVYELFPRLAERAEPARRQPAAAASSRCSRSAGR